MKKNLFFSVVLFLSLVFVSCEDKTPLFVTFEDVPLTDSIWNGANGSGKFVTSGLEFQNSYNTSWASWSGFACSAKKDTQTAGWANQYSVIAGSGAAKSAKFGLVYDSAAVVCPQTIELVSMMLTNSTWAYLGLNTGNYGEGGVGKKFTTDDWFKVIITGYLNSTKTASVEYYLADFRNGKSFISNSWNKVDVSALGEVNLLTFKFDSSDKYGKWLNTPAYICVDNIEYFETISSK